MTNDSLLKLSISLHTNPGAYALLLGSGVSRTAGIPTSWEIVLDLIRKVAKLEGEDPEPEPDKWYYQKFGKQPDYAEILEQLAATPAERNALLRSYFEPTEEEREQGAKMPTSAHKAIASLVRDGYIRLILTTNFDRLMEIALEEQGITADVISTEDALKGAMPYVHSKCTIVKLHGDYRDMRIRNITDELTQYPDELNKYLDRILDEFGLIVCGWSASYDTALRNAIQRCPSRRFTTYWACKCEPNDDAKSLIKHRRAEVMEIESADKFFTELLEKVEALREVDRPHPLSVPMAIATVKRYLSESKYHIRLHDLISDEVEKLYKELCSQRFDTHDGNAITKEGFQLRLRQYESLSETLIGMLTALSYFDKGENAQLLTQYIERLCNPPRQVGYSVLVEFQRYPALILCYATGIAALATGKFEHLAAILLHPEYCYQDKKLPAIERLNVQHVFTDVAKFVPRPNAAREYTSANNHICDILREPLRPHLPDDKKYEETFDVFEYLLGLTYVDLIHGEELKTRDGMGGITYIKCASVWGPFGCFSWRYRRSAYSPVEEFLGREYATVQLGSLLQTGFFDNSIERFKAVRESYHSFLCTLRFF